MINDELPELPELSNNIPEIIPTADASVTTRKKRQSDIANNALDAYKQGEEVATNMQKLPYGLKRFSWQDMLNKALQLKAEYLLKNASKSSRRPITNLITNILKEARTNISFVKNRLKSNMPHSEAIAIFPELGLTHQAKGYLFPSGYTEFIAAMDQLLIGLEKHGLSDFEYGLTYWTDLRNRFIEATKLASTTDTSSSEGVGNVDTLKMEVIDMLKATYQLIKIEEPDTWERTVRNVGFRREKL